MSSDATTLPLRQRLSVGSRAGSSQVLLRSGDDGAVRSTRRDALLGGLGLAVILTLSLLLVIVAANRPSLLVATSTQSFFPHWMAGPLGGLLPSLTRNSTVLRYIFTIALVAMYAGYLLALKYAPRMRARWAIAAVVAVHAILLLSPPMALTDVFNYINYGRMEAVHHLNPYTTIPVVEPHSDPAFALSNWHELLSPYGPLFTLLTFAVVPLGVAASFWALKALLMVTSLATILLVWKCARLLRLEPVQGIVLVGLNPIVLVWGLGGDHNDFFMVFFVMLAFYLLLRARLLPGALSAGSGEVRVAAGTAVAGVGSAVDGAGRSGGGQDGVEGCGDRLVGAGPPSRGERLRELLLPLSPAPIGVGVALMTAVAIKASGAILLPVVLAGLLRNRRALVQVVLGLAFAAIVEGMCSIVAFGPHIPDLATQGRLVTETSLPNLLGLALGQGGETEALRFALSGVLVLSVAVSCVMAWRRRESLTASGWASVALLVTLSWVLPWYVLWVLPLAALSRSRRLRVTALVMGVYLIAAWSPLTGTVFNSIGFHPDKTSLGRLHQRYVKELLN